MAKYLANVAVISETNLPALFYYRHLLEGSLGNPVYYFDEIDKTGIDKFHNSLLDYPNEYGGWVQEAEVENVQYIIDSVVSTVWHGFSFDVVHENVKDEGLAKKQAQALTKMIKNHEAPYNDIFKKYSVTIIQG